MGNNEYGTCRFHSLHQCFLVKVNHFFLIFHYHYVMSNYGQFSHDSREGSDILIAISSH